MSGVSSTRTHRQVKGAPDYDDPVYWDNKFATGQDVGEWLNSGETNVDFSSEAVRLGIETESKRDPAHAMHWVQADLRSWTDMSGLARFAPFDVILDKSTSDAISTSASATMTLPSSVDGQVLCPTVKEVMQRDGNANVTVSPVELLSLHLVPLTRTGSMWFALSYSAMRFDNLPYLSAYWDVVDRKALEAPRGQTASAAHTPAVYHWLYTLRRC